MYRLTYFDFVGGRGEPARLIFAAAGVKYTDKRIKFEDWSAFKKTLGEGGQLPFLEVGEKKLTQSKAIYRFLARKFKLAGADEWEAAKCDELVDAVDDIGAGFYAFTFIEKDPVKQEELKKKYYSETVPTFLNKLNKIQMENGGTWLVGKNMTWTDITIAEYLRQVLEGQPTLINGYPHVRKMQEAVFASEKIKAYRATQ